jgi:hypothetical protein
MITRVITLCSSEVSYLRASFVALMRGIMESFRVKGALVMNTAIEDMLDSFEHLSEADKPEIAAEIIRRTKDMTFPVLTDEELVLNAESLFLELDQRESASE